MRMIEIPALRTTNDDVLRETHRRACVDILRPGFGGLYHSPAWIEHLNLEGQHPCSLRLVDDFVFHTHRCFVICNLGRRDECSPVLYVNWTSCNQADVSI